MVKMLMDDEPSLLNGPFIYVMWMLSSSVLTVLSSGSSIRGMLTHSNETQTARGEVLSDVTAGPAMHGPVCRSLSRVLGVASWSWCLGLKGC